MATFHPTPDPDTAAWVKELEREHTPSPSPTSAAATLAWVRELQARQYSAPARFPQRPALTTARPRRASLQAPGHSNGMMSDPLYPAPAIRDGATSTGGPQNPMLTAMSGNIRRELMRLRFTDPAEFQSMIAALGNPDEETLVRWIMSHLQGTSDAIAGLAPDAGAGLNVLNPYNDPLGP